MAEIDRGEGHPLNAGTGIPEAVPRPAVTLAGMADLAKRVNAQRARLGARLILRHGPGMVEALRPYSSPRPGILPDPPGLASYLQVEFHPVASMGPGAWLLLRDGEVVADGQLGITPEGNAEAACEPASPAPAQCPGHAPGGPDTGAGGVLSSEDGSMGE